jgi:hypothetical protein
MGTHRMIHLFSGAALKGHANQRTMEPTQGAQRAHRKQSSMDEAAHNRWAVLAL